MDHLQALVDGMSAQWARERAETQMTLGRLIEALELMPSGAEVDKITGAHSYRGYYCDLAFQPGEGRMPAADLLAQCKDAMGRVFIGYKGGDYVMGALTPVWVAPRGNCGDKLMSLNPATGVWTLQTDEY